MQFPGCRQCDTWYFFTPKTIYMKTAFTKLLSRDFSNSSSFNSKFADINMHAGVFFGMSEFFLTFNAMSKLYFSSLLLV